jgi:hypothetical protein
MAFIDKLWVCNKMISNSCMQITLLSFLFKKFNIIKKGINIKDTLKLYLSSCSRYNANFKLDQSVSAIPDSPPYFWDQWGWPSTEASLVSHACDHWWILDFANAFVSPGVNSRGGISTLTRRFVPSALG